MSGRYYRRHHRAVTPMSPPNERAAAILALNLAARACYEAYEAWQDARTDSAERKGQRRWEELHERQNAAARRLHSANRALGRQPGDTAP